MVRISSKYKFKSNFKAAKKWGRIVLHDIYYEIKRITYIHFSSYFEKIAVWKTKTGIYAREKQCGVLMKL